MCVRYIFLSIALSFCSTVFGHLSAPFPPHVRARLSVLAPFTIHSKKINKLSYSPSHVLPLARYECSTRPQHTHEQALGAHTSHPAQCPAIHAGIFFASVIISFLFRAQATFPACPRINCSFVRPNPIIFLYPRSRILGWQKARTAFFPVQSAVFAVAFDNRKSIFRAGISFRYCYAIRSWLTELKWIEANQQVDSIGLFFPPTTIATTTTTSLSTFSLRCRTPQVCFHLSGAVFVGRQRLWPVFVCSTILDGKLNRTAEKWVFPGRLLRTRTCVQCFTHRITCVDTSNLACISSGRTRANRGESARWKSHEHRLFALCGWSCHSTPDTYHILTGFRKNNIRENAAN